MNIWPPVYNLRYSARVKGMKLQVCAHKGLEVVVSKRFKIKEIPFILEKHRTWIEKQLAKIPVKVEADFFPTELNLLAINEVWKITYLKEERKSLRLLEKDKELIIKGAIEDKELVRKGLLKWLTKKSKIALLPWLENVSVKIDLKHEKAVVRYAKTRWGSCNSDKTISLNVKLLFMPKEVVEYVMIHELCHLKYLNHSIRFWNLVASFDENYLMHRKELKVERFKLLWLP
jgi:predicted metal-dependent hydrolase